LKAAFEKFGNIFVIWTPGACVDRAQMAKEIKSKSDIPSLIHSTQSQISIVRKIKVNHEQQQRNFGSFA
jgi:hypothetical protein